MRKLSAALLLLLASVACVVAVSSAMADTSSNSGSGFVRGKAGYKECSPYFSEGPGTICRLEKLYIKIYHCPFDHPSGGCSGEATAGSFPWGRRGSGESPQLNIVWKPDGKTQNGRYLSIDTIRSPYTAGNLSASIHGWVPGGGTDEPFKVEEAIAEGEGTYPAGDKFYTPSLPGIRVGEPGGPLYLEWKNGDNYIRLDGYLYLRR